MASLGSNELKAMSTLMLVDPSDSVGSGEFRMKYLSWVGWHGSIVDGGWSGHPGWSGYHREGISVKMLVYRPPKNDDIS